MPGALLPALSATLGPEACGAAHGLLRRNTHNNTHDYLQAIEAARRDAEEHAETLARVEADLKKLRDLKVRSSLCACACVCAFSRVGDSGM